ncbi:MAG TPA: hypothetical protein VKU38_19615 [Ktedonobacteraceae bacterium]|nr:hypothetical protein [Ktedonobacteraceae bacterium]
MAGKTPGQQRAIRRIWKTPGSKFNWLYLAATLSVIIWVYIVYRSALATQPYAGPYSDPLRLFGIVSFVLVLITTTYTLRRRFVRRLPGKVQNWLWLHVWFGVASIMIAFMHENYLNITHDFLFTQSRFTEASFGMSALFALLFLVLSGVVGRLLDTWQARVIAIEANVNGIGISRSVEEQLSALALMVERLSAGKSLQFKAYSNHALSMNGSSLPPLPVLAPNEVADFQHVCAILTTRAQLVRSLQRQKLARLIMRIWRYIHIPLACLALVIISYHSIFELWKMLP